MSYGNVFKILKENNKENWLLYTKHDFINKLSNDTLKKEKFLKKEEIFFIPRLFANM